LITTPYGGVRIDTKTNYGGVRNKYAGTISDSLSGLNYAQARYQNPTRGQFISEDPVFLGDPSQQNLKDPQSLNSYSYANDNPITKSDPTGNGVLEGTINAGALVGGTLGIDIDTTNRSMQLIAGPSVGPSVGARLQGSWDPNATLDPEGAYMQTQANLSLVLGRSVSRQAAINLTDPQQPLLGPQGNRSYPWSFGLNIGVTNTFLLKSDPYYFWSNNRTPTPTNWNALPGANLTALNRLSGSLVTFASAPGANLKDPNFAAALKAVNYASAPWLATSATTPSTIKTK
jgi:RHS repeat-associated protein